MTLCQFCELIKPPHPPAPGVNKKHDHFCIIRHHENFEKLLQSAKDGCELCMLIKPFVERTAETSSLTSGCSPADPFGDESEDDSDQDYDDDEDDEEDDFLKYQIDEDIYYVEDGTGYRRVYNSHDPARKAHYDYGYADADDDDDGTYKHESKSNELLQWLNMITGSISSQEQLWVTVGRLDSEDPLAWSQVEANKIITVSAGSVPESSLAVETTYCYNGCHYHDRRSLAMVEPALFTTPARDLALYEGGKVAYEPYFEFFQRRDEAKALVPPIDNREIARLPQSPECLKLIKEWIYDCEMHHRSCNPTNSKKHPTRFLYIGTDDKDVRLVVPDDDVMRNEVDWSYAALTHCWGRDLGGVKKLNLSNYSTLLQHAEVAAFPQNFQDAIVIARGLGIQYVWIDALCIIQDSAEDWAIESAKMADYYGKAQITISALCSSSASEGFLKPRTEEILGVKAPGDDNNLYIRLVLDDVLTAIKNEPEHWSFVRAPLRRMPLNTRAWTLQERIFSTRIVHFGHQQIFWQCKNRLLSEDNQYILPKNKDRHASLKDLIHVQLDLDIVYDTPKRYRFSSTVTDSGWYEAVRDYTSRSLTFAEDKLTAISSIARAVQLATGKKYLAGLWGGSHSLLLLNLLWSFVPKGSRKGNERPTKVSNGSPSWSWTSTIGEIMFDTSWQDLAEHPDIDPKFTRADTVPATSNAFGQVSEGTIEVTGWTHAYTGANTFDYLYPAKERLQAAIQEATTDDDDDDDGSDADPASDADSSTSENSSSKIHGSNKTSTAGSAASDEGSGWETDNSKSTAKDGSAESGSDADAASQEDDSQAESSAEDTGSAESDSEYSNLSSSLDCPFGRLDIPIPEWQYDFEDPKHIALYMATYNEGDYDEEEEDEDGSDYNGPQQWFLILKYAGMRKKAAPVGVKGAAKAKPKEKQKKKKGKGKKKKFGAADEDEDDHAAESTAGDNNGGIEVEAWERVGLAKTGAYFPMIPISKKEGWKKQDLILI